MAIKNTFEIVMKLSFSKCSIWSLFFLTFLLLTCLFEAQTELIRCRWKSCEVSYPKTSTYHQGGSTSFSNFPIEAPLRTMIHLVGGRVSEGSGIYLCFCYYFEQAHFVMFSGLLVFLFVKLLYYTTYFFKNCILFFVFCLACRLKK